MQKETFKNSLGFTQEEIAILLGITRSQWAMYESGKRDIPVEAKQKLIALLTATKKNKTSSKTVQKIITQENKAMVQQLQKWTKEKQYLLMRVDQEIKTAEKIRQESFAALELISTLQEQSSFKDAPLLSIQNRAEKQLKKYSVQHLTHLELKKETISHQLGIIAQKLQSYTNGAPTDLV